MARTSIEWADHSINPFKARNIETGAIGHFCCKVSGGCTHCYSSTMQKPYLTQLEFLATNRPKVELFFSEKAITEVLSRRKPTRYFWCDMTDMFWGDYPDAWIDMCFAAMALTPQHTHLVLTKRPMRMINWMCAVDSNLRRQAVADAAKRIHTTVRPFALPSESIFDGRSVARGEPWKLHAWPLPNVWLGVSAEDQNTWDERTAILEQIPAAVRFVSLEPQLSFVDVGPVLKHGKIRWLVQGGESGRGARPFDIFWARDAMAKCGTYKTAYFLKQLGSNPMYRAHGDNDPRHLFNGLQTLYCNGKELTSKGGDMSEWPHDLRNKRQFPEVPHAHV